MPGLRALVPLSLAACLSCGGPRPVTTEAALRAALEDGRAVVELAGEIVLNRAIELRDSDRPLEIRGGALRRGPRFEGRALIDLSGRSNVTLRALTLDGARADGDARVGLPPSNVAFADFYRRNGIVVQRGANVRLEGLRLAHFTDFAIIASAARGVRIESVTVEDSGGLNERGRNNTSGGILIEEGSADFAVRGCTLRRVRGNGIWTHSNAEPRSARGVVEGNRIEEVARDAIQIGHATEVRVERNSGARIGYPAEFVDAETHGTPVAIDTSGNVDRTVYRENRFRDVNGECLNLDGFHHGEVRANECVSEGAIGDYPHAHFGVVMGNTDPAVLLEGVTIADNRIVGMGYGALYLVGSGHTVTGNEWRMVNRHGCVGTGVPAPCNYALDQPDMLRSGIYVAAGAVRPAPARGNTIRGNRIAGAGMSRHCIAAAPGVKLSENRIAENTCTETSERR